MKKIICSILSFVCIISIYSTSVSALESLSNSYTYIEYLEDGAYIETTITQNYTSIYTRTTNTTSGSKKVSYINNNIVLWSVTVSGKFSYTGSSAVCTSASVSTTCSSGDWKVSNKSSNKSKNTAIAKATGKKYFLGLCIQTVDRTVKLTCSSSGKLS